MSPSEQVTGALSQIVTEFIDLYPSMVLFSRPFWPHRWYDEEIDNPLVPGDPDWKRNGDCFHVRTFIKDAHTLYHARCEYGKTTFSWRALCKHIEDYAQPYPNLSWDSRQPRFLREYGSYFHGRLEVAHAAPDGWLDLTLFEGYPLPQCLLEHIYTVIPVDRLWKEGSRGDRLPDEAWKLLCDWRQAIKD